MSTPEKLFCSIAQRQFDALVITIDTGLAVPIFLLKTLRANITRVENLTLDVVEAGLIAIEEQILVILDLQKIPEFNRLNERRLNFCRVAFICRAVKESLFPPDGLPEDDPIFVQSIPSSVRDVIRGGSGENEFKNFEQYVCKLSLKSILDSFIEDFLNSIQAALDRLLDLLGVNVIDQLIQDYFNGIAPFLNLLDQLTIFAECAFATCNFVQTALNKEEDVTKRILVERQGIGWAIKFDNKIISLIDKDRELRERIQRLKTEIITTKIGSETPGPDDVMRFKG